MVRTISGSIISTAKAKKYGKYVSPLVSNRIVPDVASLAITELPGLGIAIVPVSKPRVFVLFGTRLFTGVASKRVTELLKKLDTGRSTVDKLTPLSLKRSPKIGLSPSKVAKAKLALTGAGAGTVLKPSTGISKFGFPPGTLIALKPSKLVIDFPGRVGSS